MKISKIMTEQRGKMGSGNKRVGGYSAILLERLFQWAKRDSSYQLPDWYSFGVLIAELLHRGAMTWRGFLAQWSFRHIDGFIFIGKDVSIRCPGLITFGRSVSIHDHVRIDALSRFGIKFGSNVTIREYSTIECTGVFRCPGEALIIGNDVGISQYAFIGVRGKIVIGDNVQIGPRVTIYAENHNFEDPDKLIGEQGVRREGITIEDDCWLGSSCTILDGVTVGRGSVIAAGSVVTKDIPPYSIVVGVPGRVIRKRGPRKMGINNDLDAELTQSDVAGFES